MACPKLALLKLRRNEDREDDDPNEEKAAASRDGGCRMTSPKIDDIDFAAHDIEQMVEVAFRAAQSLIGAEPDNQKFEMPIEFNSNWWCCRSECMTREPTLAKRRRLPTPERRLTD